jgi:hypothetical protein
MKASEATRKAHEPQVAGIAMTHDAIRTPDELAALVADALAARRCVVSLSTDERIADICAGHTVAFGEVHTEADPVIIEFSDARDRMFCVLAVQGKVMGVVQVAGPLRKQRFDQEDVKLLRILGVFFTRAVEADRMQKVLASRFAQIAVKRSSDQTIGDMVARSIQNPAQLSRMLAKSFYREMAHAGFDFNQIIGAATEIISELTGSVRKYNDRKPRSGHGHEKPDHDSQ